MLAQILRSLSSSNGVASVPQLAAAAGVSVREAETALSQLEHMGYLRREVTGGGCCSGGCNPRGSSHCAGCTFNPAAGLWTWVLTERGRSAVTSAPKTQ